MSRTPDLVYLDHAATTPMRPEAVAAVLPFLTDRFGNPSGAHAAARDAVRAVDEARERVASALGCRPDEVVFCSGGTEADNLAVTGTLAARGGTAVCTAVEHHAVLHPVERAGGRVVPVDRHGIVDLDALAAALGPDVTVVSVMLANNEVGTIQPLAEVAEVVRERAPGAALHTDAVQGACWLDVAEQCAVADLVSVSGHKLGGMKGCGALVARRGAAPAPQVFGGGQERELRSGTHNVPGIVALAAALDAVTSRRDEEVARVGALRDRLVDAVVAGVEGAVETVPRDRKVAANAHLCLPGAESEALLFLLDRAGVCASAASSCASGAQQASHVLAAMGVDPALARGAVRLSLGWATTAAEVDRAAAAVVEAVGQLRSRPAVR